MGRRGWRGRRHCWLRRARAGQPRNRCPRARPPRAIAPPSSAWPPLPLPPHTVAPLPLRLHRRPPPSAPTQPRLPLSAPGQLQASLPARELPRLATPPQAGEEFWRRLRRAMVRAQRRRGGRDWRRIWRTAWRWRAAGGGAAWPGQRRRRRRPSRRSGQRRVAISFRRGTGSVLCSWPRTPRSPKPTSSWPQSARPSAGPELAPVAWPQGKAKLEWGYRRGGHPTAPLAPLAPISFSRGPSRPRRQGGAARVAVRRLPLPWPRLLLWARRLASTPRRGSRRSCLARLSGGGAVAYPSRRGSRARPMPGAHGPCARLNCSSPTRTRRGCWPPPQTCRPTCSTCAMRSSQRRRRDLTGWRGRCLCWPVSSSARRRSSGAWRLLAPPRARRPEPAQRYGACWPARPPRRRPP
mmetsp:Transcript_17934/g.56740  ORF Transcript_17934/g.56740 Transcript_17934/m.56740 type:complete len:409 (+) Transcript_17934:206-1432(+)